MLTLITDQGVIIKINFHEGDNFLFYRPRGNFAHLTNAHHYWKIVINKSIICCFSTTTEITPSFEPTLYSSSVTGTIDF